MDKSDHEKQERKRLENKIIENTHNLSLNISVLPADIDKKDSERLIKVAESLGYNVKYPEEDKDERGCPFFYILKKK